MYDKSLLAKGTTASFAIVTVIAIVVLHTGTAYAMPLAGIGGFTIKYDELRADGAYIYMGADDTSQREAMPMAVTEMQSAEIDGLKLMKTQSVEALPGLSGKARVVITGTGSVTTGQQMVKTSRIKADSVTLRGQVIDEAPSDSPRERFSIGARGDYPTTEQTIDISKQNDKPGLVMKNATLNAHYLATNKITIPGQKITLKYDPDGDGNYEHEVGG